MYLYTCIIIHMTEPKHRIYRYQISYYHHIPTVRFERYLYGIRYCDTRWFANNQHHSPRYIEAGFF